MKYSSFIDVVFDFEHTDNAYLNDGRNVSYEA
jgi:hypothetical protein